MTVFFQGPSANKGLNFFALQRYVQTSNEGY